MRAGRALLRLGAVLALMALGSAMLVLGRGHTVYLDNHPLESGGAVYEPPWQVSVLTDGTAARLSAGERGMAACMGQTFRAVLEVTWEEGGETERVDLTVPLPYNRDELMVNLPACLAGLPREVWLTPFVSRLPEGGGTEEEPPSAGEGF